LYEDQYFIDTYFIPLTKSTLVLKILICLFKAAVHGLQSSEQPYSLHGGLSFPTLFLNHLFIISQQTQAAPEGDVDWLVPTP